MTVIHKPNPILDYQCLIVGDVHNEFGTLNTLINQHKPDFLFQVGDFGFWPRLVTPKQRSFAWASGIKRYRTMDVTEIKNHNTKIHWCDGNHEDHWTLKMFREDNQVAPNVFYQKRGSTITLPDGRNVLFMGGADSIDKDCRILGRDWFPEEIITQADIENLPDIQIDIVISHTCPECLVADMLPYNSFKFNDPSTQALQYVLEKYDPQYWFFGHWHHFKRFKRGYTTFTCLNMLPCSGSWCYL
jgi:hypothetical protein